MNFRSKASSAWTGATKPVPSGLFALAMLASLGLVDIASADSAAACVRGTRDVTVSYSRATTNTSGCDAEGRSWAYHGSDSQSTAWNASSTLARAEGGRGASPRYADYAFR